MRSLLFAGSLAALSLAIPTKSSAQSWTNWEADSSSQAGPAHVPSSWEELAERGDRFPALQPPSLQSNAGRHAIPAQASSGYEAEWVPIWLSDPTGRENPAGIVDPVRDRFVFFGGYDGQYENDTWALSLGDSPTWTRLEPQGDPPSPRDRHSAIYDPVGDRMIVFGGWDGVQTFNEVWALELAGSTRWVRLHPAGTAPSARAVHAAVYDSRRHRLLVHGGTGDFQLYLDDVWGLSLEGQGTWELLSPTGPIPSPRGFHAAAYDSAGDRMVIFRGLGGGGSQRSDIQALTLSEPLAWTPLPFRGPSGAVGSVMISDPARRSVVAHGSDFSGGDAVWTLSLDNPTEWKQMKAGGAEPRRFLHTGGLDARRDRLVVFGNGYRHHGTPRAFSFADSTWATLAPLRIEPPGVSSLAYDPDLHRVVAMGGDASIWTMSLSGPYRWHGPSLEGALPTYRYGFGVIYDAAQRRFLLHGGMTYESGKFTDTWALSAVEPFRWDSLVTTGEPLHGHQAFGLALDPIRRRMVTYGGTYDWDAYYDDQAAALELEPGLEWRVVPPRDTLRPGRRSNVGLEFNPQDGRMLLLGGYRDGQSFHDLWSFGTEDSADWQLHPQSGSTGSDMIWSIWTADHTRNRFLGKGTLAGDVSGHGGLWSTSFSSPGVWLPISTWSQIPPPAYWGGAAYDPLLDRFIVNATSTVNGNPTRWWELRFHAPTPITISLASATAAAGAIIVEWHAPALNTRCAVERRDGDANWRALGSITPRGDDVLRWEDRDVVAGTLYRYRLRYADRDGDHLAGETGDLALALTATRIAMAGTHPVRDAARIRLSLANPGGASLDVVDIAGRVIGAIDLAGLRPGEREVEWRDARALESGLYFLRLRDGAMTCSARMIVVR